MIRNSRLILALDVLTRERALDLASSLKDRIDYVKIGYPLILAAGADSQIVGRSITDSPNLAASADAILKEIR